MIPENFLNPYITHHDKDREMVDEFIDKMKLNLESTIEIRENVKDTTKSSINKNLIEDIMTFWDRSDKCNFDFLKGIGGYEDTDNLKGTLGIRKKGKVFNANSSGMKQKEGGPIPMKMYPPWYEEVLCGLSENHPFSGHIPHIDLTETPPDDGHPIAMITEPLTTSIIQYFLSLQAGMTVGRMCRFYSRMGGAYDQKITVTNKDRSNISVFPITATLYQQGSESPNTNKVRSVSRIVLKGLSHARSPSDRINFVTIEIMKCNDVCMDFCKYLNSSISYICSDQIYIIRNNSIMKEDAVYNSFAYTSMFTPINLIGCMTLENPDTPQNFDMERGMEDDTYIYNSYHLAKQTRFATCRICSQLKNMHACVGSMGGCKPRMDARQRFFAIP